MKTLPSLLLILCAVLLAGCENNAASFVIDETTKDHSISLVREQSFAWVGPVEQRFVVSRFPECQRRYLIDAATTAMVKVDLYEVRPMLYAAQQGSAWYALGTEECVLQKFKEPPPVIPPGRLVGSFEKQADGSLVFKPVAAPKPITP